MFEVRLGTGFTQTEKTVASRKISIFLGVLLSFYCKKSMNWSLYSWLENFNYNYVNLYHVQLGKLVSYFR